MISMKDWERYIARLKKISDKAAEEMQAYVDRFGFTNTTALINRAYALATKYGEAAGAAACDMYDAVAAISKASVPPAVPAETATYGEVAKAVNGALKAGAEGQVPQIVSRKVKQAGADTTLKNAIRDGAEFAWVPHGDTCAFCITLASRGWQKASQAALKGGHAEHIHSNCDCEYAIRLSDQDGVRGYDPDRYKRIYYDHGGDINAIRREQYQKDKEKINAQKREAYARRKGLTETGNTAIINTKITKDGKVVNPMSQAEYDKIVSSLEKQNIEVFAAYEGDDLRYMLFIGAEGTYSNGRITHIGKIPSRGTLFEEIIHMTQSRKYGELKSTDSIELCAREIEANRKLYRYRKAYKLDESDIEDIQRNLEVWEQRFENKTGIKYDESDYRKPI